MTRKILNPRTNRFVNVGSPTWRRLVREGQIPNSIMDQSVEVLGDVPEDPYEDALKREELRSKLDDGYVPKKGRYSYAGKYVKSQSPNQKGAILKHAKDKVKEFARERYQEASDDEDLNDEIDQLFSEMALTEVKQRVSKNQPKKAVRYVRKKVPVSDTQEDSYDSLTETESESDEPAPKKKGRNPIRKVPQVVQEDSITSTEEDEGDEDDE